MTSLYIGGGTPSLLTSSQVAGLIDAVADRLGLVADAEITLEANPGPDEIGDLAGMRLAGVTRISIGAQSLDPAELKRLGRRHGPDDVAAALTAARVADISSISLDLLTDIPAQTVESWRDTLERTLELEPDHLSVYSLSLDDPDAEGLTGTTGDHQSVSRGARRWRTTARREQSQDRAAGMEQLTDELTIAAGFERYEIANLARPGQCSRHNLLYWKRRPYLALGPGAHASDGALRRTWNAARLDAYVAALDAGELPPGGEEVVDPVTAVSEAAILGLRLSEGIDAELGSAPELASGLGWALAEGLVEKTEAGRWRLSSRGRLLANEVFLRLLPEPAATSRPSG
jgi:oxygen-independent coproporphyrinogen-3 oxidase